MYTRNADVTMSHELALTHSSGDTLVRLLEHTVAATSAVAPPYNKQVMEHRARQRAASLDESDPGNDNWHQCVLVWVAGRGE